MKKIKKDQIEALAQKALASGNPYIKESVVFNFDMDPRYLRYGQVYTKQQLDELYLETARHDVRKGYEERAVGYYDKWYRYCRADEGRAYDLGSILAAGTDGCTDEFHIIPCAH